MKTLLWLLTAGTVLVSFGSISRAEESVDDLIMEMGLAGKPPKKAPAPVQQAVDPIDEDLSRLDIPETPKSSKKAKTQTVETMKDDNGMMAVEAEATEADTDAFENSALESNFESDKLKSEIAALDRQIRNLKSGADRAKKRSELAYKRLQMLEKLQRERQTHMVKVERANKQANSHLERLKQRTSSLEERMSATKQRTQVAKSALDQSNKERMELERRMKRANAQIAQEQQRQKALREKRARVEQQNRRMKSDVSRLEKKAARRS